MTWPFENDTHKIEKKLAKKSFQANRTRNIIVSQTACSVVK